MSRDQEPSPSSRHEKWKRARQRPNEEYTSDASTSVAEKIVSRIYYAYVICYLNPFENKQCMSYHIVYDLLVNSTHEGSFVPKPQHDILVEANETMEHGGSVRGVGDDIVLRVFFGTSKKSVGQVQK